MVRVIARGVHIVKPTAEFSNKGSTRTLKAAPITTPIAVTEWY